MLPHSSCIVAAVLNYPKPFRWQDSFGRQMRVAAWNQTRVALLSWTELVVISLLRVQTQKAINSIASLPQ